MEKNQNEEKRVIISILISELAGKIWEQGIAIGLLPIIDGKM